MTQKSESENHWLDVSLLDFINECCGNRIRNALQDATRTGQYPSDITVRDFLQTGSAGLTKLLRIQNLGRKSIIELRLALERQGVTVPAKIESHNIADTSPFVITPQILDEILGRLDARRKQVVSLRYGLSGDGDKTLQEIGDEFSLSRERIRQLEKKAISHLKSHLSKVSQGRELDVSNMPEKFISLLLLIGKVSQPHTAKAQKIELQMETHSFATFSDASAFAKQMARKNKFTVHLVKRGGEYIVQCPSQVD